MGRREKAPAKREVSFYEATSEELRTIDEALAAIRGGEVATDAQVEAVLRNIVNRQGRRGCPAQGRA